MASLQVMIPSFLPKAMLEVIHLSSRKKRLICVSIWVGGSHILLEADKAQLERDRLENLEDTVFNAMRRADRIAIGDATRSGGAELHCHRQQQD
ncbi:MAG: hypothetical protein IPP23_08920 [Sphingomonadales bacterium]|nr:hypothetical protein [Sphingomonadales bacterium]